MPGGSNTLQFEHNGAPRSKTEQDEFVMGTSDNGIITKRSVEKLYFPKEPGFYRPFVSKFKRRAPLINRGHLLRMTAIEKTVKQFLDEETSKSKVVVNLGCGFEPLPFRMIWKYPEQCRNVKFVDVDFPELIRKKVDIVEGDPTFATQLKGRPKAASLSPSVLLDHDRYYAIGCDLNDHPHLWNIFSDDLELGLKAVLFVSEVSIIYMPPHDATDLLKMCSTFSDARFCLLEQHLPVGNSHQFARTIVDQSSKLAPLKGLLDYPSLELQVERFHKTGWDKAQAIDLWNLWQDPRFISDIEKRKLDDIEPFNEWEAFEVASAHHFILLATTSEASSFVPSWIQSTGRDAVDLERAHSYHVPNIKLHGHEITTPEGSGKGRLVTDHSRVAAKSPADTGKTNDKSTLAVDMTGTSIQPTAINADHINRIVEPERVRERVCKSAVHPAVAEGLDIGPCTTLWTPEYLKEKVGPERLTSIHTASGPQMSFQEKNFAYETASFASFIDRAVTESYVYMRALSSSNPSKLPANLERDYPGLAPDFKIPKELAFVEAHRHSSVLRISGNITMWLHYDVMANILCQIKGSKCVILFPPSDISKLDFAAGETTSSLNIFATDLNRLAECRPVETMLSEGEILFIPACWPHATAPAGEGLSVAVNVFFRSFENGLYAAGRDVYGNRDLEMYQNGRRHVDKILNLYSNLKKDEVKAQIRDFAENVRARKRIGDGVTGGKEVNRIIASAKDIPEDVANFYLARLADELVDRASRI